MRKTTKGANKTEMTKEMSYLANCISGIIGTLIMTYAMHLTAPYSEEENFPSSLSK